MAGSLLDDPSFKNIGGGGGGKKSSGNGDPKKMIKIGVASALLAIAIFVIAWQFWIGPARESANRKKAHQPDPKAQQEYDQQQKEREKIEKLFPPSGA